MKKKKAEVIGIKTDIIKLRKDISEEEIIEKIKESNIKYDGVMVQLPLPKKIDSKKIINQIDPKKDVDGLTGTNLGKTLSGDESLSPATAKGIIKLLDHYNIDVKSKEITIINHSNIMGKPLAMMLINRGATVTICHEHTKTIYKHTKKADIVISGVGITNFIQENMVKEGSIIIDVGISKLNDKITGDVNFETVSKKTSYITPVPGGVGPMTIACLLENVVNSVTKDL